MPSPDHTTLRALRSPLRASANTFFAVSGGGMPSRRAVSDHAGRARRRHRAVPRRRLDGSRTSVPASGQVPDLAGAAAAAPVQLAVQHQAHADAGPEVQVDEVRRPPCPARATAHRARPGSRRSRTRSWCPSSCLHGFDQPLPPPARASCRRARPVHARARTRQGCPPSRTSPAASVIPASAARPCAIAPICVIRRLSALHPRPLVASSDELRR